MRSIDHDSVFIDSDGFAKSIVRLRVWRCNDLLYLPIRLVLNINIDDTSFGLAPMGRLGGADHDGATAYGHRRGEPLAGLRGRGD